jgi:uncharacterized membrane protein
MLSARRTNMAIYSVIMAIVIVAWVRLAALLFAIKSTTFLPSIEGHLGMPTGNTDPVIPIYFLAVGLMLALIVFVANAITVPAIVDRDVNPLTAIHTRALAVARNRPATTGWAAVLVALTAVGIATLGIAMVVIFPVLGYATWHCDRATVR